VDFDERQRVCKLIEAVIAADGVIQIEEADFLRRVAQRFEIPYQETEVGPVDSGPVSDPGRASAALRRLSPDARTRVMALLVDAAVTDGAVHPKEHALLLVAAAALDIDAAALEERIHHRLGRVLAGPRPQ
jgi:uncharacterized tellurite resistance protein B-like protein